MGVLDRPTNCGIVLTNFVMIWTPDSPLCLLQYPNGSGYVIIRAGEGRLFAGRQGKTVMLYLAL